MKHLATIKAINVEGLPQPVAQMLEFMVQTLKNQLGMRQTATHATNLPSWPGKPLNKMTRDEIYDDGG